VIIESDNGAEFVAARIQGWIEDRPTDPYFIEPGTAAYIDRSPTARRQRQSATRRKFGRPKSFAMK
jgi:transposase InsO family protein